MKSLLMNSGKKIWSGFALLSVIVGVLVLFGCGGGGGGGNGGGGTTNTAPTADDGVVTTNEDQATTGSLSASDADGDALTYSIVTGGGKGTAVITDANTGSYTYTPDANENGADTFTFKVNDGTVDSNTATVTVTINPVNDTPQANAGGDQSVAEQSTVNLSGSGNDIEDGLSVNYSWSQIITGAEPNVSLIDADTATPSFTAPAVSAQTAITLRLTVTDGDGGSATDDVTVNVDNAGNLSGSVANASGGFDLGSLDWAHWGHLDVNSFNHKSGVTQQIGVDGSGVPVAGGYEEIGSVVQDRSVDRDAAFSWTGGTETATVNDTQTGLRFGPTGLGVGEGFSVVVPAGLSEKTLKLYIGAFQAQGTFTASLSDASAPDFTVDLDNPLFTHKTWVVTLNFGAEADGETLTCEFIRTGASGGQLNLVAANLDVATAATPTISPPGGAFTDSVAVSLASATPNSTIRYTLDGSTPTQNSTLFTGPFLLTADTPVSAKAFFPGYNQSDTAAEVFTVTTGTTGALSAFVDNSPNLVDLDGSLDWAHWGHLDVNSFNHKSGVTQQIGVDGDGVPVAGGYEEIGSVVQDRSVDRDVAFSWTGGTQTATVNDTQTGLRFGPTGLDVDEGFRVVVPAGLSEKTLKLYIGSFQAQGTFTASLSDASAPDFTVDLDNPLFTHKTWVVTLNFRASADGETLTCEFVRTGASGGQLNLVAANLD